MNEESKANGARDILSTEFAKIAFQTLDGPVTITNEVENNLFIELKNLTKDSYPQALYQMHTLLCRIRNYYNRVKIGISPAEEKKAALDAAKTLNKARSQIESLGYRVQLELSVTHISDYDEAVDNSEVKLLNLSSLLKELENWEKALKYTSNGIEVKKGRASLDELDEIIIDLALVFEMYSGNKAGYSSQPINPKTDGQNTHGPFVRFCKNMFSVFQNEHHSTIDNAIRRYVSQCNK